MTLKVPIIDTTDRGDDKIIYWDDDASIHKYKDEAAGASAVVPWAILPFYGGHLDTFSPVGASNRAIYAPCVIPADCTITGIRVRIGTSSGNICVGLYDSSGNRVATSGSTASPGTGFRTIAFGSSYAAAAGRYYLAIAADNNTVTFGSSYNGSTGGPATTRYEESAFPLPATATMSNDAVPLVLVGLVDGGYPS